MHVSMSMSHVVTPSHGSVNMGRTTQSFMGAGKRSFSCFTRVKNVSVRSGHQSAVQSTAKGETRMLDIFVQTKDTGYDFIYILLYMQSSLMS